VIQRFTTTLNPAIFDSLQVLIFGRAGVKAIDETVKQLGSSDFTARIVIAGGNDLYITGYLDDLAELEDYTQFVKTCAKMPEAVIGIVNPLDNEQPEPLSLTQTDFRIVQSLRHDSRRSYSDLANELEISVKTVKRRLDKMLLNNNVLMSIDFMPESTGDIIAIFDTRLKEGVDVKEAYPLIINKYSSNLIAATAFTNIPDLLICAVWAPTMKDVRKLHDALLQEAPVESVVHNISYTTHVYYTWMDKYLVDNATSKGKDTRDIKAKTHPSKRKKKLKFDLKTLSDFEAYRRALVQALMDGVITTDEEAILRSLRDSLDITEDEHNAIFRLVSFKNKTNLKELETYRRALAQALEDGIITEDEQAILEALRDTLEISQEDHAKLLKGIKQDRKKIRGS
ncbi:MAG: AsnC family transcriptional regulator, partial [Thermoplasmata archaeon]|nr:AsnC family transcriptional regulator [Thermoplasmata archaeon]